MQLLSIRSFYRKQYETDLGILFATMIQPMWVIGFHLVKSTLIVNIVQLMESITPVLMVNYPTNINLLPVYIYFLFFYNRSYSVTLIKKLGA